MNRPGAPGPMCRRGPRPLAMHLMQWSPAAEAATAGTMTGESPIAGMTSSPPLWNGLPPSSGAAPDLPASAPGWADSALIRGIAAYRRHPAQRTLPDPPVLWEEGESRLLDFAPSGLPVLFVPSLVNRAYVLDLSPERSMMRWLAGQGVRPLLLDWGWPGPDERCFTLSDYIDGRLQRAVRAVGQPVVLAGYCMGGLLTLALALRQPALVRALALLAVPWDFHADDPAAAIQLGQRLPWFEPALQLTGTLPVDALQALFALPDPASIAAKYRAFGRLDQAGQAAADFVLLEDWLNDGVPLAAPVARETIAGWYGANTPGQGLWLVNGAPVRPEQIERPTWVAVPARDRIVPPASALPLASHIGGAILHRPAGGHIGMTAGPRAEAVLWRPMLDWLRTL